NTMVEGEEHKGFVFNEVKMQVLTEAQKFQYPNDVSHCIDFAKHFTEHYDEFAKQLERVGLEGKRSGEKFIPEECLLSNIEYRKKLLAGLIDSDGYVNKKNHIDITTKSKRFAKDIENLVFSLGGHSNIRETKKKSQTMKEKRTYYDVNVSFENPKQIPLKVKFKKERLGNRMKHNPRHIAIECIKLKKKRVFGFEIDSSSKWYITDNWMVTHNSSFSIQVARRYLEKYFGTPHDSFDMEKYMAYTNADITEKIYSLPKYSPLIGDEAVRFAWSRDWNKAENKELAKLSTQIRTKKLIFFMNIPKLPWIDSAYREQLLDIWVWIHSSFAEGKKTGYAMIFEPDRNQAETDSWHLDTLKKHMRKKERIGRFTEIQRLFRIVKYNPCFVDAFPFPKMPEDLYESYLKVRDKRAFETAKEQIS
ncbi:hypothetical protein LCGC14_2762490, partial [marine sediment metagenome]